MTIFIVVALLSMGVMQGILWTCCMVLRKHIHACRVRSDGDRSL